MKILKIFYKLIPLKYPLIFSTNKKRRERKKYYKLATYLLDMTKLAWT